MRSGLINREVTGRRGGVVRPKPGAIIVLRPVARAALGLPLAGGVPLQYRRISNERAVPFLLAEHAAIRLGIGRPGHVHHSAEQPAILPAK